MKDADYWDFSKPRPAKEGVEEDAAITQWMAEQAEAEQKACSDGKSCRGSCSPPVVTDDPTMRQRVFAFAEGEAEEPDPTPEFTLKLDLPTLLRELEGKMEAHIEARIEHLRAEFTKAIQEAAGDRRDLWDSVEELEAALDEALDEDN